MPIQVNIHEAKTQLSKLLQRVMNGEEIVIANRDVPVARLIPYMPEPAVRRPGPDAGVVVIAPDFDEPLAEFEDL